MNKVQERVTAARRELRAALKAKKTAPKIYNNDEDEVTYEYADVAEAIKQHFTIIVISGRVYIAMRGGSFGMYDDDSVYRCYVRVPEIVYNYGVTYDLRYNDSKHAIPVRKDSGFATVAEAATVLQNLRRAVYDKCVELIKEAAKDMSVEEANDMPF